MPEATEVLEWRGRTAVGADGSKLGKIEEIYLDAETRRPEWALIQTGMFGGKSSFMPLQGATSEGDQVRAPFSKDQVKDAPQMEPDGELSQQDEAALYSHYGIDYDESRSDSGLPEGRQDNGRDTDNVGRDEERLPPPCPILGSVGIGPRSDAADGLLEPFVTALAHGIGGPHDRGVADELGRAHALARGFAFEQLPELAAEPHGGRSHRHATKSTRSPSRDR